MQFNGVNNKERQCALVVSGDLDMPMGQGPCAPDFRRVFVVLARPVERLPGVLAFSLLNPFPPSFSTV